MKGPELKAIREKLRLTQAEFARVVGVASDRTVRKWEDGEREIPGTVLTILDIIEHCPEARKHLRV